MNGNEIVVRNPEVIAAEINVIKKSTAEYILLQSIRIGQLLTEAKSAVPYGEWGGWLEANFDYSVSTANNLMRIFNEYGEETQVSFFEENRLELFGHLNRSQAVSLLALPRAERAEFVKAHDMDSMSVRDLDAEIAKVKAEADERIKAEKAASDEAVEKALVAEKKRLEAVNEIEKAKTELEKITSERDSLKSKHSAVDKQRNVLLKEKSSLLEKIKLHESEIEDAKAEATAEAEAEIERLKKELEELTKKESEISPEMQTKLEEDIRTKIETEKEAEIEQLKKQLDKAMTAADPNVQKFAMHLEGMKEHFNAMREIVGNIEDSQTSAKLAGALARMIDTFADVLAESEADA